MSPHPTKRGFMAYGISSLMSKVLQTFSPFPNLKGMDTPLTTIPSGIGLSQRQKVSVFCLKMIPVCAKEFHTWMSETITRHLFCSRLFSMAANNTCLPCTAVVSMIGTVTCEKKEWPLYDCLPTWMNPVSRLLVASSISTYLAATAQWILNASSGTWIC